MKKIFFVFLLTLIPNITFWNVFTKTQIQNIWFQYVSYDVSSKIYKINAVISDDIAPLSDLAISENAITAINGVFFCPADYSECNGKNYTINERFIDGEDLSFYPDSWERWVFGWNEKWVPFLHQTGKIAAKERENIYEWLGNFPILYANGKNMLEHYHDIWLYDNKMRFPAYRHFICTNKERSHIILGRTSPTSLDSLAPALYELGCWDALNLDAWNSAQFIYNGRYLAQWSRDILDAFSISHRDIDVSELEEQLDNIFKQIQKQYKKYPSRSVIKRLESFLNIIPKVRTEIYESYSEDILDAQWNIIGYQTEITSLSELKRVYMINGLEKRIKEFRLDLMK